MRKNVIIQIFSFLNGKEILKCALVSKEWKKIALSDAIWKKKYEKDFVLVLRNKTEENFKFLKPKSFQHANQFYVADYLYSHKPKSNSPFLQEYKLVLSELKRLKEIENDLERIVSTGLSPKNQLEESEENKEESVEPIDSFYDQLSYRYL